MKAPVTIVAHEKRKGYLRAAFAAVALVGGCFGVAGHLAPSEGGYAFKPVATHSRPAGQKPAAGNHSVHATLPVVPQAPTSSVDSFVISVFGDVAMRSSPDLNPLWQSWGDARSLQERLMERPDVAKKYNDYLALFDGFRGEPLRVMASHVNTLVEDTIAYSAKLYGESDDHWAAPAETVLHGKGDCKDQTGLQYAILRHLGVPEKRLMIAIVSIVGSHDDYDHAFLLLNVAPADKAPHFVILNDVKPVIDADNALVRKTWVVRKSNGTLVRADVVPYYLMNQGASWQIQPSSASGPRPGRKGAPGVS